MFGWELPPQNSGGLGVACYNLAKALVSKDAKVTFVLPKRANVPPGDFKILFANAELKIKTVDSLLSAYLTSEKYSYILNKLEFKDFYGDSLFDEVLRYGKEARKIALAEKFDVIHAHDWLSFPAGVQAKLASGKPLILHIHATEFDRTGGTGINQLVYDIEKWGMEKADKVLAVSNLTKNIIVKNYGIPENKVEVVYNGAEEKQIQKYDDLFKHRLKNKAVVAFAGRITVQKGPDYFLAAAKRCLEQNKNILFVMAGSGDMQNHIIRQASYLGIADNFLFAGFLRGEDLDKFYQSADLLVMPSVSEPFGLIALEAAQNGTPVLISKQSGVGEGLIHCLKTDFWDVEDMSAKILSVVEYKALQECLSENGAKNAAKFSWYKAAEQCLNIYNSLSVSV